MAFNVFADVPAVIVTKTAVSFSSLGLDETKVHIIYLIGSPIKSFIPGRPINPITAFEAGKGYYMVAKVDIDLTAVAAPPLDVPGSEYYPAQSGTILFTDDHFQAALPGYDKAGGVYQARNTASFVEFRTSETNLSVKVAGDWIGQGVESQCEVLVDGVYNQSLTVTAVDTVQDKAITLPAGEKIVRLVNGYCAADSGSVIRPNFGVWIQGLVTTGDVEIKVPVIPLHKWLFVGDSITTGASGTHPSITGYVALIRETVASDGVEVAVDAWGARRFTNTNSILTNQMAAQIVEQLNGSVTNELFLPLGTNNFGIEAASKAYYKGLKSDLVLAINALRPDVVIWLVSILDRSDYSTPNVSGATGFDYSDADQEIQAANPSFCYFIEGKDLMDLANAPDGVHPNQTGMNQIAPNLLADRESQLA